MRDVTVKFDTTKDDEIKTLCDKCDKKTYHVVLKSVDEQGKEEYTDWSFNWDSHFQIIQCRGCKTISFRKAHSNSEEMEQVWENEWAPKVKEQLFPPRMEGRKGISKNVLRLPKNVRRIYQETNRALVSNQPVLTGIGLRAIVETICKDQKAEGDNLLKKIDSLVDKRLLTPASAAILHNLRVLGNKSAHEVKPHTVEQLSVGMDVIDHLLMDVYILPSKVKKAFDEEEH
jgi:hypothetical protein